MEILACSVRPDQSFLNFQPVAYNLLVVEALDGCASWDASRVYHYVGRDILRNWQLLHL